MPTPTPSLKGRALLKILIISYYSYDSYPYQLMANDSRLTANGSQLTANG